MLQRLFGIGKKQSEEYRDFESLQGVNFVPEKDAIRKIGKLSSNGWGGQNSLLLGEKGIVYMMPHNSGMPTCPFVWYQNNDGQNVEIINNQDDFTQLQNLPDILNTITDVMVESYNRKQAVVPFSNFGIQLTDEIKPNYTGNGNLVLITGNYLSPKAKKESEGATTHFANDFLDRFIGWNFGDVVKIHIKNSF